MTVTLEDAVGVAITTGAEVGFTRLTVGATVRLIVGAVVVRTGTGALVGEATAAVGATEGARPPPLPFPIICKSAQFQNFSKFKSGQELGEPGQLLAKLSLKMH